MTISYWKRLDYTTVVGDNATGFGDAVLQAIQVTLLKISFLYTKTSEKC